jgi:hypothetical protein
MKMSKALPLLLAVVAGVSAGAADLDYSMKLRGIVGTESKEGVRNGIGLGLNVGIPLAKGSKVDVEVGYRYLTGDGRDVAFPANALGSTLNNSTNFQKTNVQGFVLRGAYSQSFMMDNLSWHAGLSVNFLKSRMDAISDFRSTATPATSSGAWAINPEKNATTVSPFVGLAYDFSQSGGMEVNLIMDSYKQVTVDPNFTTTPITPSFGSKNINTLKVEVGYTFRF